MEIIGGVNKVNYEKVKICGINTSALKTLPEKEKIRLLKLSKSGDKKARENLINGNLRLVLSVIQKFAGRLTRPHWPYRPVFSCVKSPDGA